MAQSSHTEYEGLANDTLHEFTWMHHYGDSGAFMLACTGEGASITLSAGWGNIDHCPMCGKEIELFTAELD